MDKQEWRPGKSLPPVGYTQEDCRTSGVHYQDFPAFEVIAHRGQCAIVWVPESEPTEHSCGGRAYALRPWHFSLRDTAEDRAIRRMAEIMRKVPDGTSVDECARLLHRAGYRKIEE